MLDFYFHLNYILKIYRDPSKHFMATRFLVTSGIAVYIIKI